MLQLLATALAGTVLDIGRSLEDNFALGMTVFVIGLLATLVTLIYIVRAHRYWQSQPDPYVTDDAEVVVE